MAQYYFFFFCPLKCLFSKGWHGCIYPLCPFCSLSPGSEGLCRQTNVCVSVRKGEVSEKETGSLALKSSGS